MVSDFERGAFVEEIKSLGSAAVRDKLSRGEWVWPADECAREWLEHEDKRLGLAAEAREEVREEENLSISRKALVNSERATRIAVFAIVLSIGTAVLEIVKWYSSKIP